MSREDLKDIICRVIEEMTDDEAPQAACFFGDAEEPQPTTKYGINEEG